jgi:hypothetical protein
VFESEEAATLALNSDADVICSDLHYRENPLPCYIQLPICSTASCSNKRPQTSEVINSYKGLLACMVLWSKFKWVPFPCCTIVFVRAHLQHQPFKNARRVDCKFLSPSRRAICCSVLFSTSLDHKLRQLWHLSPKRRLFRAIA